MKKLLSLVVCFIMIFPFFAGCSLVTKKDVGANATAIRVGDEIITRSEVQSLFTMYWNQGFSYYYSEEDLLKIVINMLVNEKIALNEAKKVIVITEEAFKEILESVEESLNSAIDSRESAIFSRNGEDLPLRLDTENQPEDSTPFESYDFSKIEVTAKDFGGTPISGVARAYLTEQFIEKFISETNAVGKERADALLEYFAELVQVSRVEGTNLNAEQTFINKIDEMIASFEKSYYLEKFQEYVESTLLLEQKEITDEDIWNKYLELINIERQKYVPGFSNVFEDSDGLTLLYDYKNENDKGEAEENGYVFVQHILLQFSDEIREELSKMIGYSVSEKEYKYHTPKDSGFDLGDTLPDGSINRLWVPEEDEDFNTVEQDFLSDEEWSVYLEIRTGYLSGIKTTFLNNDGEKATDSDGEFLEKSLLEIEKQIQDLVSGVGSYDDGEGEGGVIDYSALSDAEKMQEFRRLIFIYGADPGMLEVGTVAEKLGYVLPLDSSKLSSEISSNGSGFVGEFASEVILLLQKEEADPGLFSNKFSDGFFLSDHGAHFMMITHVSEPGELAKIADKDLTKTEAAKDLDYDALIDVLKDTYISKAFNQTIYQYIYEQILESRKSSFYADWLSIKRYELGDQIEYKLTTVKQIFG